MGILTKMAGGGMIGQLLRRKLKTQSTVRMSFGALSFLGDGAPEHLSFATVASCYEADHGLQCPSYIWSRNGNLSSHVHASLTSNFLLQSTYSLSRTCNVYKRGYGLDVCGLKMGCGFHSQSFRKSHWFSPLSTRYIGRYSSLHNIQRSYCTAAIERKSKNMLFYLVALVLTMVGCSYAAVPLYRRFCQATGYGGTVQRRESVEEKIARHAKDGTVTTRDIVVQFNADVADGMPWKFIPTQREVRVKPGESALAFYTAENKSSTPITGVSTYNVTPMKAAIYFNKIQCFCFEEQRLLPGEQIDMPVFFYIDPEFETDPKMDGINNLILSYTFFKVSEE
ncbi:cytochrome c oxidase assembly protein COX11, mitochondrial isoform X1 [Cucumis melo]|uniref:Cytochrome c oxidase assembly protein COX11, mitochondrial isoform X1 n=1 Tax=Cucumis melo TaxID=3656 RepID=A0ABM3KZL3_CUCME|nr:cytochrome c oxidase assembly protein COX11, mitochondrial isoform X1 [Cucumis melo]XP_008453788.2 cytochrome c oxidase assembly protein COX11, mitochondrial isoform X1 [Cucumis melo]XP_008453791.2 cytochrome c oxidase assembly protein COX11, mitochondrial isoform X1 [Cucumis melo]XP_008453792.2 cytochrome c oxidase assembly protein COX11, mitochondrial isoform X1 [Cucumis melo]XP_050943169.1 cytochrome c oxidase assembly protein COX11, mitochondrial isoform X1 [Cucumis melo]XP_050943170.1 